LNSQNYILLPTWLFYNHTRNSIEKYTLLTEREEYPSLKGDISISTIKIEKGGTLAPPITIQDIQANFL